MTLIAENIKKVYNKRAIVNDISVEFNSNEVVGILGPNGAGKSTLFSILAGIIKPDYGSIILDGHNITKVKIHKRAKLGLTYLPQDTSIFQGLNVEDNIKAILEIAYDNQTQITLKLNELLAKLSLEHIRKSTATQLSGGERRKVEIARALALSPKFIFLDEPFAGVDPISIKDIISVIHDMRNSGIGVIITDHNVRDTLQNIDRGYIISDGRILYSGSGLEIATDKNVNNVYLGDSFHEF